MIELNSKIEQQTVLEAVLDPNGYKVAVGLYIEDEPIQDRWLEGEWGQSDIPVTLDATLIGRLPRRLEGGTIRLYFEVEDILVPQLISAKSQFVLAEEPGLIDLLASTPGALLNSDDAITLQNFTKYSGLSPESIIRDVLFRLPYQKSLIQIQAPGVPLLSLNESSEEQDGFEGQEKTGAVLERVSEETGYAYRDTPDLGHVAYMPQALALGQEPITTFQERDLPNWLPPERVSLRYFDVRVFRKDGEGGVAFDTRERIEYRGLARQPYPGQTLDIELEDFSGEGFVNARRRALAEAKVLSRGVYGGEVMLPAFNPLIQREDRFAVVCREENDDGLFEQLWLCKVDAYKHSYATSSSTASASIPSPYPESAPEHTIETTVTYTALLLEEHKVGTPSLIGALSPGQKTGGSQRPQLLWGEFPQGTLFFNEVLPWVSESGDDLIFDDEVSGGIVNPDINPDDVDIREQEY